MKKSPALSGVTTPRVVMVLATITVLTVLLAPTVALADDPTTCPTDGNHWYGRATAPVGAGTAYGSYIIEYMPTGGYYTGSEVLTDEAAWVENQTWIANNSDGDTSSNGSWELGWFQGNWPYGLSGQYFYAPHAYYTTFAAYAGHIYLISDDDVPFTNNDEVRYLVGDTETNCPYRQIFDLTTQTEFYRSTSCFSDAIIIPTPRDIMSQGEILNNSGYGSGDEGSYMGGDSGYGLETNAFYQAASDGDWYAWSAGYAECDNSPYWISYEDSNSWLNGGGTGP